MTLLWRWYKWHYYGGDTNDTIMGVIQMTLLWGWYKWHYYAIITVIILSIESLSFTFVGRKQNGCFWMTKNLNKVKLKGSTILL